jgi:hypothetical protein
VARRKSNGSDAQILARLHWALLSDCQLLVLELGLRPLLSTAFMQYLPPRPSLSSSMGAKMPPNRMTVPTACMNCRGTQHTP